MDYLIPLDQAQLLCAVLGLLSVLSFVGTKAAEVWGLLK